MSALNQMACVLLVADRVVCIQWPLAYQRLWSRPMVATGIILFCILASIVPLAYVYAVAYRMDYNEFNGVYSRITTISYHSCLYVILVSTGLQVILGIFLVVLYRNAMGAMIGGTHLNEDRANAKDFHAKIGLMVGTVLVNLVTSSVDLVTYSQSILDAWFVDSRRIVRSLYVKFVVSSMNTLIPVNTQIEGPGLVKSVRAVAPVLCSLIIY